MTIRAKQGGEVAPNGAFYKGGQFINTIPQNDKRGGSSSGKKQSKTEVAPYHWMITDSLEQHMKCIYLKLKYLCQFTETSFKSGDWKVNRSTVNQGALEYQGMSVEEFARLADLFDNGERFHA
jgi:hypothetical protein